MRRRIKPMALCGSSNAEMRWRCWQMQPVRFEIEIKFYTVAFGEEKEISEEEAAKLGNLAVCKRFKRRR